MKRQPLILAILLLCGCSGLTNTQQAAAADLPRHWIGIYYYESGGQRRPIEFELRIDSVTGNTFTARTREAATFGDQPCSQLTANVVGQFTTDRISFTKTYDGTCNVSHSVQYQGTLSLDSNDMKGTWHIGPTSGQFTAEAK